jgi:hypothetical protein
MEGLAIRRQMEGLAIRRQMEGLAIRRQMEGLAIRRQMEGRQMGMFYLLQYLAHIADDALLIRYIQ